MKGRAYKFQNMKKTLLMKIGAGVGLVMAILPMLAFAQLVTDTAPITSLGGVQTTITAIVNWMIVIFWIVAVAFMIWAAFTYLTAGGEEDKLTEAKSRLIYALVAAAVALLSGGIKAIATSLLTGA